MTPTSLSKAVLTLDFPHIFAPIPSMNPISGVIVAQLPLSVGIIAIPTAMN
jgi:hypothetical protein